ncbi:MAG: type II toxin-antitoxin system RelB/DinJ family antitoxin [Selenomonadaceae bacterium]|nr:type II toxin-antitoxin system RelB/DinJ family antitoxin [Selenomonadaceae bacterium]
MADKITVEIELDADLKEAAEKLYTSIGLTLSEAISLLVKYNVNQSEGIPVNKPKVEHTELFGALAKYANPALIPFEKSALERAVVKKYVESLG